MPYIVEEDRQEIDQGLPVRVYSEGQLNYKLTRLVRVWLGKEPNYARINAAIGVLECAKIELYRRIAAPYEDTKIEENGDVY